MHIMCPMMNTCLCQCGLNTFSGNCRLSSVIDYLSFFFISRNIIDKKQHGCIGNTEYTGNINNTDYSVLQLYISIGSTLNAEFALSHLKQWLRHDVLNNVFTV